MIKAIPPNRVKRLKRIKFRQIQRDTRATEDKFARQAIAIPRPVTVHCRPLQCRKSREYQSRWPGVVLVWPRRFNRHHIGHRHEAELRNMLEVSYPTQFRPSKIRGVSGTGSQLKRYYTGRATDAIARV